ncbi:hypothetical protein V8C44DRAFT_370757 [Trichoderma aethiopicum]
MPCSSTKAVYDGSDNGTNHSDAIHGITDNNDAIHRFLADQEQHRPLGCGGPFQPAAEAEAAAKARILAKLHALEKQLSAGNKPRLS